MKIPTLDDERIDTMRRSVMHRVDQDVRRRGRRLRRTAGLAAASVVVVGIGGYTVGSIDQPGGVSDSGGWQRQRGLVRRSAGT